MPKWSPREGRWLPDYQNGDVIFTTWGGAQQGIGIVQGCFEGTPDSYSWLVKPTIDLSPATWNIRHATPQEMVMLRLTGRI